MGLSQVHLQWYCKWHNFLDQACHDTERCCKKIEDFCSSAALVIGIKTMGRNSAAEKYPGIQRTQTKPADVFLGCSIGVLIGNIHHVYMSSFFEWSLFHH